MIVGFTITDLKGYKQEAIEYIQKVCILESPDIAKNIVEAGKGVNVFSLAVTYYDLSKQPFSTSPIETQDGKYVLFSIVNFTIELTYNSRILKLVPTEYIYIDFNEIPQFKRYIEQGLVKVIPDVADDCSWILDTGAWDDKGTWSDSNFWRDSK